MNIAEQAERVRVPKLQTLAWLMLSSILMIGVALWAWENISLEPLISKLTFLNIEEVRVTSEWPLTPSTLRTWLPHLEGKNILLVSPGKIIAALKEKPWVEGVTLKKEYPNRLLIEVTTKRARALSIVKGQAHWLDAQGQVIERATPSMMRALDLPVISMDEADRAYWPMADVIAAMDRFHKGVDATFGISQIVLGPFPLFKIFLTNPRVEVAFNFKNWESQLPILSLLLHNPPSQIGQPQRINLILAKKAVVSTILSN